MSQLQHQTEKEFQFPFPQHVQAPHPTHQQFDDQETPPIFVTAPTPAYQTEDEFPLPPDPEDFPPTPDFLLLQNDLSDDDWPLPPLPEDIPLMTDANFPSPELTPPPPTPPRNSPHFTGRDLQPIFHSVSPPSDLVNDKPLLSIESNIGSIMREIIYIEERDWEGVAIHFLSVGGIAGSINKDVLEDTDEGDDREDAEQKAAEKVGQNRDDKDVDGHAEKDLEEERDDDKEAEDKNKDGRADENND